MLIIFWLFIHILYCCLLLLTMTLCLLRERWWSIVCPPSDALLNFLKGCISAAEYVLLPANQYSDVHQGNHEFYPDIEPY